MADPDLLSPPAPAEGPRGRRRPPRFLPATEAGWEVLLPSAVVVGLMSGASAVALRSSVHVLFHALHSLRQSVGGVAVPAIGAAVSVLLVTVLFREQPGHGVPEVIRAVCRRGGHLPRRAMVSRWLGSLLNVSSGGSAGLEGPIVYSAAALGSSVGRYFRLNERRRIILLACGSAGGISAIFNAPLTGMIFSMEIVLAEWSALSIVPVVVSAVVATEVSRLLLGNSQSFLHAAFSMGTWDLVACLGLGMAAGLTSIALTSLIRACQRLAARLPTHRFIAPALFGLGVGLCGLIAPGALGEGYGAAQEAINSEMQAGVAIAVLLLATKVLATGLTLGSGAPGGVFAPCLVIGAFLGVCYSRALALLPATMSLAGEGSYALVGMSGLVAGVMQAPLTGILLVFEVTGGYEVILPLMLVSVTAFVCARLFSPYSLYTQEVAARGELLRAGTDERILADIQVREALDVNATPITDDLTLAQFREVLRTSQRDHFPVFSAATGEFVGMLQLQAIRDLLIDPDLARLTLVRTVMDTTTPTIPASATLADALKIFDETRMWVLPVLEESQFLGLLSKSTLFDYYRRELAVQVPR